jgi:hypothetical protein
MLFLLTDEQGRALLIAESGSRDEADRFGRNHLPEYRDSIEIDYGTYSRAPELWRVRTVRLVQVVLNPDLRTEHHLPAAMMSVTWVRGPELPEDIVAGGALTTEDLCELTRDHIARTSAFVVQLQIVKRT